MTQYELCSAKIKRLQEWSYMSPKDVQQPQPAVGVRVGPLPD